MLTIFELKTLIKHHVCVQAQAHELKLLIVLIDM